MKEKIYNKICFLLLFAFGACQTSIGPYITTNDSSSPDLEDVSNSMYVFTEENEDKIAETFNWTSANYGYNAAIQYDVQMDFAQNEFKSPVIVGTTSTKSLEVSVNEFNEAAGLLGVPFNTPTDLEVRVMARAKAGGGSFVGVDPLLSDTLEISVTSYEVVIVYPKLYVPGSYQDAYAGSSDWNIEDEVTTLESLNANDNYEGYLYFPDASTSFKVSNTTDWADAKGDDDNDGVLNAGNDAMKEGSGYYKFNVNWATGVYTSLKTEWSIIGSSTPNGWDDPDTDMILDKSTQLWEWTGELIEGELKFRANDSWGAEGVNYGLGSKEGELSEGADNIPVLNSGMYTIILDLNQLPYSYSIEVAK